MKRLNDFRNSFIHFGPSGWSIELVGLPLMCLRSLDFVEHLGWNAKALAKVGRSDDARKELVALQAIADNFPGKSEIPTLLEGL